MIYFVTYFFTKFVSLFYFPRRIYGKEHIPAKGGFILASNHISNLDPVVLGISAIRRINFLAKIELFQKQPIGFFLRQLGAFPVKRGEADLGALKEALKRLKREIPVLIFVEGTRRTGNLSSKAQPGIGFLAVKSGVPVIPVYVRGTDKVMSPGQKFFTRGAVSVHYGPAVVFDPKDSYENIAAVILDSIYRIPAAV